MCPLPLPTQTLKWLAHAEQTGQSDAQVLLHLLNRADANDQDVAKFLNSYNATIAALCRRLEALERGVNDLPAPAIPPAPVPGEVANLHPLWYLVEFLEGHSAFRRQTEPTDELAEILSDSATLLRQQDAELSALRVAPGPTFQDAIRLAQGCHDYLGGYTGAEGKAWHGAIDTVVGVLRRAAVGPWDSQTRAVFGVGSEAQAVPVPVAWCRSDEFANSMNRGGSFNGWKDPGAGANKCDMQLYAIPLPAPAPVAECPNCGHEGEMVQATQAGKVEA